MPRRVVLAVVPIVAASCALAGPLAPLTGPVAPTAKPLAEIEPRIAISAATTPGDANSTFRITQPGSYYLAGPVTGQSGRIGIEIAASSVTLDLNGFTIRGVPGSLAGIAGDGVLGAVAIRNGVVAEWGGAGVDLGTDVSYARVESVTARSNGLGGIRAGRFGTVVACVAANNGGPGVTLPEGGIAESCQAIGNTGTGFAAEAGSSVVGCVARENLSSGFTLAGGVVVTRCVARANRSDGFRASDVAVSVTGCVATRNWRDGIAVLDRSLVLSNLCANNGAIEPDSANIRVTGSDSRVEGNNAVGTHVGVLVLGSGNVIVRNTCSGNGLNWQIAANNVVGPVVDRTAPASAAVSGNAGAGSVGTADPFANITY